MESNLLGLLFLLLPLAFTVGWWTKSSQTKKKTISAKRKIHPDYFKGLNYVLNEQPDKAIEVFVKMVELDSETVETHLTLGNLFRRRGEVDRAIRIHQNLIARPALDKNYRAQALLELGLDYLRLGILDRAESLFLELIAMDMLAVQAFINLLEIYQQEKDWIKAISTAKRLETITNKNYKICIAQFYCELAETDIATEDVKSARTNIKRALNLDPKCVRASLMEGQLLMNSGNYRAAIISYKRIEKQDDAYLGEMIFLLQECYQKIGKQNIFRDYLQEVSENNNTIDVLILLTDIIAQESGENAAIKYLSEKLKYVPTVSGVDHFLSYVINKSDGDLRDNLSSIKELTSGLLQDSAVYRCRTCGFGVKKLHWQCPGCKNWTTLKPVETILNE